jgi:hypothetical protein
MLDARNDHPVNCRCLNLGTLAQKILPAAKQHEPQTLAALFSRPGEAHKQIFDNPAARFPDRVNEGADNVVSASGQSRSRGVWAIAQLISLTPDFFGESQTRTRCTKTAAQHFGDQRLRNAYLARNIF